MLLPSVLRCTIHGCIYSSAKWEVSWSLQPKRILGQTAFAGKPERMGRVKAMKFYI